MISIVASKSPQYDCSDAYSGSIVCRLCFPATSHFVYRSTPVSFPSPFLFFFSTPAPLPRFFTLRLLFSSLQPGRSSAAAIFTRIIHSSSFIFIDARPPRFLHYFVELLYSDRSLTRRIIPLEYLVGLSRGCPPEKASPRIPWPLYPPFHRFQTEYRVLKKC